MSAKSGGGREREGEVRKKKKRKKRGLRVEKRSLSPLLHARPLWLGRSRCARGFSLTPVAGLERKKKKEGGQRENYLRGRRRRGEEKRSGGENFKAKGMPSLFRPICTPAQAFFAIAQHPLSPIWEGSVPVAGLAMGIGRARGAPSDAGGHVERGGPMARSKILREKKEKKNRAREKGRADSANPCSASAGAPKFCSLRSLPLRGAAASRARRGGTGELRKRAARAAERGGKGMEGERARVSESASAAAAAALLNYLPLSLFVVPWTHPEHAELVRGERRVIDAEHGLSCG